MPAETEALALAMGRHAYAADPVGSLTCGSKFGFRRSSCFRCIFYRETRPIPHRNLAPGRILWVGCELGKRKKRCKYHGFRAVMDISVLRPAYALEAGAADAHEGGARVRISLLWELRGRCPPLGVAP